MRERWRVVELGGREAVGWCTHVELRVSEDVAAIPPLRDPAHRKCVQEKAGLLCSE